MVWISLPCTGGSPFQSVNKLKPGGIARLHKHWRVFRRLWIQTRLLIDEAVAAGFTVALEWPSGCAYWKWKEVHDVLTRHGLRKARCNGCALGLKGNQGLPI